MVNDDLADGMVEPAQRDHDAGDEQEQADDDGGDNDEKPAAVGADDDDDDAVAARREDERVGATSLYCSLPLSRDVQSIIDAFAKGAELERKKSRKLPCLYCERTFVADGLRQKHVERCHSAKQARRSSSRFQQGAAAVAASVVGVGPPTLQCQFCDAFQPAAADDDQHDLFRHLVGEHADRYFACVACRERFVLKTHLDEHREEAHGVKREHVDDGGKTMAIAAGKVRARDAETIDGSDATKAKSNAKTDRNGFEQKELRGKKAPSKSTKLGTKRSARLQNKETSSAPPGKNSSAASGASTSSSSAFSKRKGKPKDAPADPTEREMQRVAAHENPYPTFDAFYRVKKITDHSIDNLRITSLTFSDVFDQAFYTRIKCNIADNLQNHIDGKLFKNEESESRISNFEKSQAEIAPDEHNYGCEISLHAATPVAHFLSPQLGDDPEAQIEYGSKASKKKARPDEVHYKYFTRRKYQASIREIKENRDLSKLDMWTQYVVKDRQQAIANTARSEKEKQDYKKGDEYRAKLRSDELNRILDRRGPFEDLKLEANKQAALDGNASREARVEASCIVEELLRRVFDVTRPEAVAPGVKTELTDAEIPGYLNLRRASSAGDAHVDRSDRITLICSSEETENFEAPQASPRDKHALVELSGEWTRSRLFICAACGTRLANMRALIDHKNGVHQNVWCQHYEFVGKQGAYYKHLSIPGLGKMNDVEAHPAAKSWVRSAARLCTKCGKTCNTLGELHRHILECGEDWSWMLIRRKCKYRPYGAKTRRKRRGLLKRHETSKKESKEKKTYKRAERPREKPSDAETIQRMLANLPAKRATRKEMSLKDGFPKARKKPDGKSAPTKMAKAKARADQHADGSATTVKRKLGAGKCNPVNNVRKSVRNLNKVISSSLIDNNIMVRRKMKAMQAQRATTRARVASPPPVPVDLTEEQRAEEVKKKISLFKRVQKFRESVIKKRTKVSSSSAESVEKLAPDAGGGGRAHRPTESWRQTRSASNLTDTSSSSSSDKRVKSPIKKKSRANLGARLLRTLSMRRKDVRARADGEPPDGSTNVPEKRKRFAGIKSVVKKLKVTNRIKRSDKKASKSSENEESTSTSSANGHFLEGKSQGNAIRTISDFPDVDKRDNDNRPTAHTFPINSVSDNQNKFVGQPEGRATVREVNEEKRNSPQGVPIIMITLADGEKDTAGESRAHSSSSSTMTARNCRPFNETLQVCVGSAPDTSHSTAKSGELTSPPIVPSLSPLLGRSKNKLCKRAKGLNDCIAMLTSKLQCKDGAAPPTAVHSPVASKDANCMAAQQQPEAPVVVVTPHDTTTEEQNVVIPEETVSENLESAKEPEAAPPSPPPITDTSSETTTPPASQTAITIDDLSGPVIEQDKENIEMEQKSLMPTIKQGYDVSLDLIKRFEDIRPKEMRNGHLDHAMTDVINGLKAMPKKATKQARKIGSARKTPKRVVERTLVREQLNVARLEEDLILNDLERKIGGRRSAPQRRTKKAFVDLKIPEIKLKHRNCLKGAPTKDLSTIPEESAVYGDLSFAASDKSQVASDSPRTPLLVHAVQREQQPVANTSADKDELPVDLSLARTQDVPEDAPVDLSTRKAAVAVDAAALTQSDAEILVPAADALVNFHCQSHRHAPLENEEVVLENKAIPQLSTPRDASSESEDELPLAALLKTKTSNCDKLDGSTEIGQETTAAVIATSEHVKSQIQDAFTKKVKKFANDVNQNRSNNRKRRSENLTPATCARHASEPIVISDGENDNEASEAVVMSDEDLYAFTNSSTPELKRLGANFPRARAENVQSPKATSAAIVANRTERDLLTESVVCTPDLGLQSTNSLTPTRPDDEIDFEDVIPVVSISPSEAVKYKRNRIPEKTISEIMADGAYGNNATCGSRPKAKRGRKPKARMSTELPSGPGKKTLSVCQLIDKFQCKAKQLDFRNLVPIVSKMADQEVPDVNRITDEAAKNVVEECDIKEEVEVGLVAAEAVVSEIAAEIVSDQNSSAKTPTVKVRKVGRPKSKKSKKVAKPKKPKQPSLDSDGDVLPKLADEGGQNINISETETVEESSGVGEAATEMPEKSETMTENVNVNNLEMQKDLEAEKNAVVMTHDAAVIPVETETFTALNISNLTNNERDSVQDTRIEPMLALTTPVKAKSKRGRKPRVQKSSENIAETVEETTKGALDNVSEILTHRCLKTRARKRKSHELNTTFDISTSIGDNSDLNTSTSFSQSHAETKSIAIYDFDDVDEGAGDNSKENIEEPKTKSPKRPKRNGQSPGKAHTIIDEKQTNVVENISEEMSTPLKDVQNESFIQTPDLDDSVLGTKIASRFKVRKGKHSKSKKSPVEHVHYCDICNKQFGRLDSLNKHKRTLTHIAKLSEIEALEAEAKKRQSESAETERQAKSEVNRDANEIAVRDAATPEKETCAATIDVATQKIAPAFADDEKSLDALVAQDIEMLDETNVLSPTSEFMRGRSQADVTKNMLVASPFSLKTNDDALRLADIISDVLNKPAEGMEPFADAGKQSPQEPKRYKSLGERKSFDSDSVAYTPTFNISPASTLINKSSSDEFLKNQLSLLENIIEENKASFEYIDEASAHSVLSIESEKSDRCPSDMSLVSDIEAGDSSRIISVNEDKDKNFVKPNAHYEEISDDSMNNRNYEQERSRKTLNRDEELFLECCSLLKSSSEVSECKKSRAALEADYNAKHRAHVINDCHKPTHQDNRKLAFNDDDFMSDSCPNTPIGNAYDDFSNSETIKTDWSAKLNDKEYENVSQSSMAPERREENNFTAFNFKLDCKSDIDESSNSVDFRKNINAKFVGLMAEALKGKSPRRKKQREHQRRKLDITQPSIIDYAVQLTPKSSSNSADIFTDFTNDSKKVMTKGAMKVFEGLRVSIPTDEIDMNQVLDCSPTSKRLEIAESAKIIVKSKGLNFGNKLGLKVTKRRNARSRNVDAFLTDGDKLHDVYDFEETQDNTDLFSPASKLNFRNGSKLDDDDLSEDKYEDQTGEKNKVVEDMIESESESNNQDLDLFAAEAQSVNSFSTETESSTSVKPPTVSATHENITKKKCQIMGRIFKNAIKAKVDGSKGNTPVDDVDALENYIIGGPLEGVATPPPEKLPEVKDRPKMSEKEMDLLFDKLLQSKDDQQTLKVSAKVSPIAKPPNSFVVRDAESAKHAKRYPEHHHDNEETKEGKARKATPKSVKANRRRSRKHSESSDDEFNLAKTAKKRQARKSKPRDNGINLDEEMKECMGVAGRKSQRKCTSGKQNVLIEYWSSDDSEFEAMLRLSMLDSGDAERTKEAQARPLKTASTPNDGAVKEANIDANEWRANEDEPSAETPTKVLTDSVNESFVMEAPAAVNAASKNKKRSNSSGKRNDSREGKSRVPKTKHPRAPRSAQDEATLAANRRKRAAVDTLYYWSSSSEDDTENMIEVKSVRDEIDDEEDRPQHGWIVGDSPKKLVTLLAHAKGKKTNR